MREALLVTVLLTLSVRAQDASSFSSVVKSGKVERVDRWMKRELHRQRKGYVVTTPSTSYVAHHATFDSLAAFLRRQPGVRDAAWDGCMSKIMIWPGHSTIGLRVVLNGVEHERCYHLQEGIPGTLKLFGWRPHVRKDREQLKFLGATECPGFVEEQRRTCGQRER